jgi:CheY-like chemotaxis protein
MAHILVIDDEPAMREAIQKMLVRAGHQVTLASNGKEGLAFAAASPPDLVVTDVFMPEKDGIETTIALRKGFPNVKIIAVSGGGRTSNFDFLEIAKSLGAHAVLQKPVRMADLLGHVTALLGSAK